MALYVNAEPVELTCHRCQYSWTYEGANPFKASCPYCKTTVKVGTVKTRDGRKPKF